jgi:hypothetical protein
MAYSRWISDILPNLHSNLRFVLHKFTSLCSYVQIYIFGYFIWLSFLWLHFIQNKSISYFSETFVSKDIP